MTKTGVFATKEELEFLFEKVMRARNTPCFGLSSHQVLSGNDFASMAHRSAQEACHEIALKHGLPEITGFYGISEDGEFITV